MQITTAKTPIYVQPAQILPPFPVKTSGTEDSFCNISESKKQDNLQRIQSCLVDMTPDDIKKISKMTNKDAAKYCFDHICNQWGLDDAIKPKYKSEGDCSLKGAYAAYSFMTNELSYSETKNENAGKWWIVGLIRHEMEHYKQMVDILRSDELYSRYIESIKKSFSFEEMTSDESLAKYEKGSEIYNDILEWRNNPELFEKDFREQLKAPLDNLRQEVLKRYPSLKEGDEGYNKAKKICDSLCKEERPNRDNIFNSIKYFTDPSEFHACRVQGFNWINYGIKKIQTCIQVCMPGATQPAG